MTRRTYKIRSKEQLRTLVLPLRTEIVGIVAELGPHSAADLSDLLGKHRPAIHYQIQRLLEVGLLEVAGTRGTGRNAETLYQTPGKSMDVVHQPDDPAVVELTIRYAKSLLQRAGRVLARAFAAPGARTSGRHRDTHANQITCRLNRSQLEAVNECIEQLYELCAPETLRDEGDLFLVTLTLSPYA